MIASLVKRTGYMSPLRAFFFACLTLSLFGISAANSQEESRPLLLVPGDDRPTTPSAAPTPEGVDLNEPDPTQIQIGDLQAVDADALGVSLSEGDRLGDDLWAGSDRARVAALIEQLPVAPRSPFQRHLTRRLLLNGGQIAGSGEPGIVLHARLTTLLSHGDYEGFDALYSLIPMSAMTDQLRMVQTDSRLLRSDLTGACDQARDQLRLSDLAYWQAVFLFCQIQAGETAAAQLSRTLLMERAEAIDPGYFDILSVLMDESDNLPEAFAPSALNMVAYLSSGEPLPVSAMEEASPGVLVALLGRSGTEPETRLMIAEQIAAVAGDALGDAYAAVEFADEDMATAIETAQQMDGALGRALLYQAFQRPQTGYERAVALDAFWKSAVGGPGLSNVAGLTRDAALSLPSTPSLLPYAEDVVRVLGLTRDQDPAQIWLNLLLREAPFASDLQAALVGLRPLAALADLRTARDWTPDMAMEWFTAVESRSDFEDRYAVAEPVFIALDALGFTVGPEGWWRLFDGPPNELKSVPSVAIRYGLRDAARAGQRGETLLYILTMLGQDGPAGASPLALGAALRGLRALGLEHEARALAVEAIADRGL